MSKHVIHFYGPITPISFQSLRNVVLESLVSQKPATEISLLISSEGGDLNSGFTAYNFIRSLSIPVTCINMGSVESIAVILYLAADRRLALPESRFLLHSLHWGFNAGLVDQNRLAEFSDSLAFDRERYARIFDERTQSAEHCLDVREALNHKAKIFGLNDAFRAGIVTACEPAEISISCDNVNWWPPMI